MEVIWPTWHTLEKMPDNRVPVIVPRPMRMEVKKEGAFRLLPESRIFADPASLGALAAAKELAAALAPATGLALPISGARVAVPPVGTLALVFDEGLPGAGEEGYKLEVTPEAVVLSAASPVGMHHGVHTVRQLLPKEIESRSKAEGVVWEIPCLSIEDRPRFPWRGYHLDCCRHFMDKEFVKRYIDLLAYHKLNRLHWHLTEDQGWRIQVDKFPRLTEVAAWREDKEGRYGGFYSKADIREIVAHAAKHNITVVPEIEMPGHSQAALAAYPELSCTGGPFNMANDWGIFKDVYCAGNDKVFEFLEGVLTEVLELFPGKYVHIGADECPKERWKACPKCQARIRKEKLKDEFALQTWFVGRIAKWLRKHGKTVIAWDEILEGGAPPGVIVQAWRGHHHGERAAREGSNVIVSPYSHVYFDYDPKYFGLRKVFSFDPMPEGLPPELAPRVLGTEGLLWTEFAPQETVDHKTWPRLCGIAEVGWSPVNDKDWVEFQPRCRKHCDRLRAMGVDVGPEGQDEG